MVNSNQFSLRALMIAMVVISVLCCIFFTLPEWAGVGLLLLCGFLSIPAILCLIVYGQGYARAFAVGAIPPVLILFLWFLRTDLNLGIVGSKDALNVKIAFTLATLAVVASGFIGQAVRWWCLPRLDDDDPVKYPHVSSQTKSDSAVDSGGQSDSGMGDLAGARTVGKDSG